MDNKKNTDPKNIQESLNILQTNGLRITKQRLTLLNYLSNFSEKYVPVTEINQYIHTIYPTASYNTIYSNIDKFIELNIVEKQNKNGQLMIKYQCDFNQIQHGHFFCTQCHRIIEINSQNRLNKVLNMDDYQFDQIHLEVSGICNQCLKENDESEKTIK